MKLFQRRLKEETKQISVTEEAIFSELEAFESRSLQQVWRLTSFSLTGATNQTTALPPVLLLQVKEASGGFEEKLSFLKSEVTFMEKVQKIISSTQVHIKAEVPACLGFPAVHF